MEVFAYCLFKLVLHVMLLVTVVSVRCFSLMLKYIDVHRQVSHHWMTLRLIGKKQFI